MTKVFVFATAAGCLCSLWGCALGKDSDGLSTDPVFNVYYQIDDQYYNTVAGEGGIYLFTYPELTPDEVWQYSGSFSSDTCPTADCPGTLSFRWRNNGFGDDLDSASFYIIPGLIPEYRYFRSGIPEPLYYQVSFECYNDSSDRYVASWTLNGDPAGNDDEHFFRDIWEKLPLEITCAMLHESGVSSRISQRYSDYSNAHLPFGVQLRASVPDSSSILLAAQVLPPGNYTYNWSNGNTTPEFVFPVNPAGAYTVTVSDAAGNTAVAEMKNILKAPKQAFPLSIGYLNASVQPTITAKQGGFIVEWIDPQGIKWSSDLGDQYNQGHYFRLLDVQPYLPNENGQPTLRLRVEWKCRLYNDDGAARLISGSGVIALAWWQ